MSCRLPVLDPFHPSIMKYISATSYPECPGKQYGELVNGRLQYSGDYFACTRGAHLKRALLSSYPLYANTPGNT